MAYDTNLDAFYERKIQEAVEPSPVTITTLYELVRHLLNKLMSELAFENFPGIPKEGDSFRYLGLLITILSMKRSRIWGIPK